MNGFGNGLWFQLATQRQDYHSLAQTEEYYGGVSISATLRKLNLIANLLLLLL